MVLSKSSRNFGKTSQSQWGPPWTSLPVIDSTPREASKGNNEMYQTLAGLAKNNLHPRFPWLSAMETLQTARGHPGRAHSRGYMGPPRSGSSKSTVFQAPSPGSLPSFWLLSHFIHLFAPLFPGPWDRPTARNTWMFECRVAHVAWWEGWRMGPTVAECPRGLGVGSQTLVWAGVGKGPMFTATHPATSSKFPVSAPSDLAP